MNRRALWSITRKDMFGIQANIQVWLPMIIVPSILGVIIPGLLMWLLSRFGLNAINGVDRLLAMLEAIPSPTLRELLATLPSDGARLAYIMANYMLAPLFLLIPLMVSSVVSADSFAGEKERGTLESLLFSPVDLPTIFAAKTLAALLPSLMISYATFALAAITLNATGYSLLGRLFFPRINWLPLMLLVIPTLSLAVILLNVFISARVATFQAAYQLAGVVVLPAIALVVAQVTGILFLDVTLITALGLVLAVLDVFLLRQLARHLDRQILFESQVR